MNRIAFILSHKYTKILGLLLLGSLAAGLVMLISSSNDLLAGILPPDWNTPFEKVREFIEVPEGNAVDKIRNLFWDNIVPIFKYVMVAAAILFYTLYLYQMVVSSGDEEGISKSYKNLLWGILGFAVIAVAIDVAEGFDVWVNGGDFVNRDRINESQRRLVSYFQLLAGIVAFFYIFFAGFRMITAAGDEEIITAQKNHIKWGFVGLIFVMLADPAINLIFYPNEGTDGLGDQELSVLFAEGLGVLKFFLTFTGVLALISLVVSAFLYVTSFGDESATEKAKKNIIGSLIALVIIVMAFVLIAVFVGEGGGI